MYNKDIFKFVIILGLKLFNSSLLKVVYVQENENFEHFQLCVVRFFWLITKNVAPITPPKKHMVYSQSIEA
jgi:hypothetical protein